MRRVRGRLAAASEVMTDGPVCRSSSSSTSSEDDSELESVLLSDSDSEEELELPAEDEDEDEEAAEDDEDDEMPAVPRLDCKVVWTEEAERVMYDPRSYQSNARNANRVANSPTAVEPGAAGSSSPDEEEAESLDTETPRRLRFLGLRFGLL